MSDQPLRPAGEPGFWTLDRIGQAIAGGPSGGHSAPRERHRAGLGAAGACRPVRSIATDSRTVGAGDLFVALVGERFDGHDFLSQAVAQGAAAVVVARPERAAGLGVPVFAVPDTLAALAALGLFRRRAWGKPVVAVAGSNGKTSTKELMRAALSSVLEVHATSGNYNNAVGVPLTLLSLFDAADIAVVEIGTNAPGEVAALRDVVEPDVAVVTSIGEEHLQGFGDLAGVLEEEAAVLAGAPVAIVPASDRALVAAARARCAHVVEAGLEEGDVRASSWHLAPDGRGELTVEGVQVSVPLRGVHNLRNAMLALAVARACGIPLEHAAAGIAGASEPAMRSAWVELGRATLINDAYNANPASARAALDLLESVGNGRQRVVVLGTMRELGPTSRQLHAEIARRAIGSSVDIIAGVGDFAPALEEAGAGDPRVLTATEVEDLWPRLRSRLAQDAVVLLKASRGVRLERLVPPLTEWATP